MVGIMEDGGKHQNMLQDSESLVMVPLTEILLTCVSAHFVKSKVTYISIYKDWHINQAGWHLPRYVSEPVERRDHGALREATHPCPGEPLAASAGRPSPGPGLSSVVPVHFEAPKFLPADIHFLFSKYVKSEENL